MKKLPSISRGLEVRQLYVLLIVILNWSASQILSDVHLNRGKESEFPDNLPLKILRPLYGFADSGDYRNETFAQHTKNDLEKFSTAQDIPLFFSTAGQKLKVVIGTCVDDRLFAADQDFLSHSKKFLSISNRRIVN